MMTLDLGAWKKRWTDNAAESEANSLMDQGWSEAVAERCRRRILELLTDVVRALAFTETKPADLFDRPDLVRVQEAARFLMKQSEERPRKRIDDPSYTPTMEEAMRDPEGFVDGMAEE